MSERIVFEGSSRLLFLQHTLVVVLASLIVFFLFYILILSRKPRPLSDIETIAIENESKRAPIRTKLMRIKESLLTLRDEILVLRNLMNESSPVHLSVIAILLFEITNDLVLECVSARAFDLEVIDQQDVNVILLFNNIECSLDYLSTLVHQTDDETVFKSVDVSIEATKERWAFGKFLALKKCERRESSNARNASNLTDANG